MTWSVLGTSATALTCPLLLSIWHGTGCVLRLLFEEACGSCISEATAGNKRLQRHGTTNETAASVVHTCINTAAQANGGCQEAGKATQQMGAPLKGPLQKEPLKPI